MSIVLTKALQRLLASSLNDAAAERELCSALEWSIPGLLKEQHDFWNQETLDGVLPIELSATGNTGLELFGRCILMSDQTLVPILVSVSLGAGEVAKVSGFVGEPGDGAGGMQRTKYGSPEAERQYIELTRSRPTQWVYQF